MSIKPQLQQRGTVGVIMVVMILGLLMTVSTAYIKMIQTETEVQSMVDHSDRALDAAFSGVNYAIAIAQTNQAMFNSTVASQTAVASRTYITSFASSDWRPASSTWTNTKIKALVASVPSDWLFLNDKLDFYHIDAVATATMPPYHFRVTSFLATTTTGLADPTKYLIKSQGRFLTFADNQKNVTATFSAQIIAECSIDFTRKLVQLKRYRYMTFQTTDATFFKATNY